MSVFAEVGSAGLGITVAALAQVLPIFFVTVLMLTGLAALSAAFPSYLDLFVFLGALLLALVVVSTGAVWVSIKDYALLAVLALCFNAIPHVLLTLIAYVIAAIVTGIGASAAAVEDEARGSLIGINGAANIVFAVLVYPVFTLTHLSGPLAIFLAIWLIGSVAFMAILPLYRADSATSNTIQPDARSLLGWASSFLPTAWFTESLGMLLHLLSLLAHVLAMPFRLFTTTPLFTITGIELARDTGTITMRGGIASNLELGVAYNLGRFSFVRSVVFVINATGPGLASDTPSPTTVHHEAGHHLNLAAFGTAFHFIGFIEEMLQAAWGGLGVVFGGKTPTASWAYAYSEQLATTNTLPTDPSPPPTTLSMWVR